MSGRSPGRPGWYRDPADPTCLRHWDGDEWDGRWRDLPAWSIAASDLDAAAGDLSPEGIVYEGPVRTAPLPAGATTPTAAVRRHRSPAGGRGSGHHPEPAPAGWATPSQRSVRRSPWTRSRSRMVVAFALVGVVSLTLASSIIGTSGGDSQLTPVRNTAFLRFADAACASAMATIRIGSSPGITAAGAPATTAVAAANRRLDALAARLEAGAARAKLGPEVGGWLQIWRSYATARARAAEYGGQHPDGSDAARLAATAQRDASRADRFALANGLDDCTLAAHAASSAQVIP